MGTCACGREFAARGKARRCHDCYEAQRRERATHVCGRCEKPFEGFKAQRAKRCPDCRYLGREWAAGRKKYVWTEGRDRVLRERYDGRVKGRAREVADSLGWPVWQIKRRAMLLGLTYPASRRDWTAEEERQLVEWAGSRTVTWIAHRLSRSENSVVLKMKHMQISRRFREGYTLRELQLCFGVDHHSIDRWIRLGQLKGERRGTRRLGPGGRPDGAGTGPADPWVFQDSDVLRFVIEHPLAFRLDKVDQTWFLDLLTGGGILRKALAEAERDEMEVAS